ncbi:hypothetical protein, partial [Rhizobium anhuiense]
ASTPISPRSPSKLQCWHEQVAAKGRHRGFELALLDEAMRLNASRDVRRSPTSAEHGSDERFHSPLTNVGRKLVISTESGSLVLPTLTQGETARAVRV